MAGAITRDRILALQAAYIRCIDNNALESWPDFFVDRCLYVVTSAENHKAGYEGGIIYADTKDMLIDRVAAVAPGQHLREAELPTYPGLAHRSSGTAATTAESETPFMVARISCARRPDQHLRDRALSGHRSRQRR